MAGANDRPSVLDLVAKLDAAQLALAFELRPDLLAPRPPVRTSDLAERVAKPASVGGAIAGCDRWCRQLIEVALVLRGPTSAADIARLIRTTAGDTATEEQVGRGVTRLTDRLLFFVEDGGRIWLNPGLVPLVRDPCGLGPRAAELLGPLPVGILSTIAGHLGVGAKNAGKHALMTAIAAELADTETVANVLADAPEESLALLEQAASRFVFLPAAQWTPKGLTRAAGPHDWLIARGFLVDPRPGYGYGSGRAEVPREVTLALRRGAAITDGVPDRPPLARVPGVSRAEADRRGAAAANATIRHVGRMIEVLETSPAATLKAGGVGSREVGRIAKALAIPTNEAFVLLEVAAAAGIVPYSSYESVAPTAVADEWLGQSPGRRWLELAFSWFEIRGIPSIAGQKGATGKVIPAFVTLSDVDGRAIRRAVLDSLASAEPGERIAGDLVAAVRWEVPVAMDRVGNQGGDLVAWTMAEAERLGLVVDGLLTDIGRMLHAGEDVAAYELASSLLTEAPAEVILQADLTAVVDAAAPQRVLDELRLLADPESAGSAIVLRFSAASVRRALDAGRDAAAIIAFLKEHAARGVPQPLEYLVADTARRWGSVRIGATSSYVRADDPVLLEEVVRHRRLAKSGLRLIAPTVALSVQNPEALLAALREAGFLPVEEDGKGAVLHAAPRRVRSKARTRLPEPNPAASSDAFDLRALAESILAAGPETESPSKTGRHDARPPRGRKGLSPSRIADLFGPLEFQSPFNSDDTGAEFDEFDDDFDDDDDDEFAFDARGLTAREVVEEIARARDGIENFEELVGAAGTGTIVEVVRFNPVTGKDDAITGPVVELDLSTNSVTMQREPDGAMVTVSAADIDEVRILRVGQQ